MKRKSGIILGLIAARGGSKGIINKNIRHILGKPLIVYAIECGLACSSIDKVVVSTDSLEIAEISRKWGAEVPFMRPSELAHDETPILPVMQHALESVEKIYKKRVDALVLLDPTSPLRKIDDVENALALFYQDYSCQAVISGSEAHRSPYFNMVRLKNGFVQLLINTNKKIGRRQDCPPVYDLDTTVWIYSREALMDIKKRIPPYTRFYMIPETRAFHIDTELDLKIVEFMMSQNV